MFSWISTNTSMSAKRRTEARVSGRLSAAATASASGRLLLQATIFMRLGSSGGIRLGTQGGYSGAGRGGKGPADNVFATYWTPWGGVGAANVVQGRDSRLERDVCALR